MDRRHTQNAEDFIASDLRQMKSARRYNAWLYAQLAPYIGRYVFEVGAGIGNMTGRMLDAAKSVTAMEPNSGCRCELVNAYGTRPGFACLPSRLEDCLPESVGRKFDTVLCVNVLEHIPDDVRALRIMSSLLHNDGNIVVLAPACPFALGPIDMAVGHFRRYSKKRITDTFREVGLIPQTARYLNFLGLLGWLYNARVTRTVTQHDRQVVLFDRLVPLIAAVERCVHPPIGLSIIAVAGKPT